jgi:cytoskeletal protein RodZ
MKEWSRLKKTVVISAVTILGLGGIGSLNQTQQNKQVTNPDTSTATKITTPKVQSETTNDQTPASTDSSSDQAQTPATFTPVQSTPVANPEPEPLNCPNGTYVNVYGNTVCSPYSAPTTPAGATAQCLDGTYSFSQSRSGTCSHHGGVSTWL